MPSQSTMIIEDGIIAWFDGPEWDAVAEEVMKESARRVDAEAQANAPWEDRTGDARSGLTADVTNQDGIVELTLYHTVDYGLWLEVIQNGRFAIIMPTLEGNGAKIFSDAADAISNAREGIDF